jgi:hypothetical protein
MGLNIPIDSRLATWAPDMGELEDKDSIRDLIFRYAYLTDHKLHDRVAAKIFSDDAVLRVGSGVFRGRDAIGKYYGQGRNALAAMVHQYTNVSVDVDGDQARGRSYVTTGCGRTRALIRVR